MINFIIIFKAFLAVLLLNFGQTNLYVSDGDSIHLNGEKIRLTCIDAPEITQPYGLESKEFLMKLLRGKSIKVVREGKDRYGRTLAWLYVNGENINYKMVEAGFAWWYEYYCGDNKTLERLQDYARKNKLGLWNDSNPINPYQWRKGKRE